MPPTRLIAVTAMLAACVLALLLALLLAGCGGSDATPTPQPAPAQTTVVEVADAPAAGSLVVAPDPDSPSDPSNVQPLQASMAPVPQLWIVPADLPKAEVAARLHTNLALLEKVNRTLPDPVPADTDLMIPQVYKVEETLTLAEAAGLTGRAEAALRAANPQLEGRSDLAAGEVLALPPLYALDGDATLEQVAEHFMYPLADLQAANPDVAAGSVLPSGTILVIPVAPESP